uniref:Uncharacterized protein n=1 Tax=Panagrolaimus sp. JU765 TaxID=591449 RepID=A0AC34RFN2_9BILA
SAFNLCKHLESIPAELAAIQISVADGKNGESKGIYLREPWETRKFRDFLINVGAKFKHLSSHDAKLNFERKILLKVTDDGENFIQCPEYFKLSPGANSFTVRVDPTKLEKGIVHFREIYGIDVDNLKIGPVFRIPVTVMVPQEVENHTDYILDRRLLLEPAVPDHFFVKVPAGASYA